MRTYRGPEGDERLWFEDAEIDQMMEDELHRARLWPDAGTAVDVESFIENHLKASLDQYADLEPAVLGLTEFRTESPPLVRINRDLTGSAMDDEWCPPGIRGRWRATLAHEASHIALHRLLFTMNPDQTSLFTRGETGTLLFRCLKREVSYRTATRDWREVQANRGMATLLMPKPLFLKAANRELSSGGSGGFEGATRRLATLFEVSREAAAIRLKTFGFRETSVGGELFAQ